MPTEQEYAEARENWDSMTGEDKEEFVEDVINDTLNSYGYDPVDVETEDLWGQGDDSAAYWSDDGTITFDEDHLYDDDFDDVMDTAFHEAAHAMQDPEEPEIYEDEYEDDADFFAEEEAANQLGIAWNEEEFEEAFDEWWEDNMEESSFLDEIGEALSEFWDWLWGSG